MNTNSTVTHWCCPWDIGGLETYPNGYELHYCRLGSWYGNVNAILSKASNLTELRQIWTKLERLGEVDAMYGSEWHHAIAHMYYLQENPDSVVISATCSGCGHQALDEEYYDTIYREDTGHISVYWVSDCIHNYEPGDTITCDCGMRCPWCQTEDEIRSQLAVK